MKTFALDLEEKTLIRLSCPRCWSDGFRALLVLKAGEATPEVRCPRCGTWPAKRRAPEAA